MARFKFLILGLLLVCNFSFAGYAQLKPPPGWSQGMGAAVPGQSGVFAFGAAANAGSFKGSTVLTNAALSVAGQFVTIPVSMRVAANAASVAATWSFGNPLMFAGVLAATSAYSYYKDHDFEVVNGVWKKREEEGCTGGFCGTYVATPWDGYNVTAGSSVASTGPVAVSHFRQFNTTREYQVNRIEGEQGGGVFVYLNMRTIGATDEYGQPAPFSQNYNTLSFSWVPKPSGGVTYRTVSQSEFVDGMKGFPLPDTAPAELPEVQWPVQQPVLNPDPAINPLPSPSPLPVPRPLWVPLGDPVKQPSVEGQPDTWKQSGVRVIPSPTESDPWRVDVQPEDKVKTDPSPNVDEVPVKTETKPETEPTDFCKANPDVLACQKFDTPDSDDLETKDKTISITPDSGWGSGSAGSCPAPRHFSKGEFSFQIYCDFASGIKPVIIAVAWLVAAGILIGFKFGES